MDSNPVQSKYLQLAEDLQQRICGGQFAVGDRLPPIQQMADDAGVSLVTMARAVRVVAHRGIVSSRPGGGTVVVSTSKPYDAAANRPTDTIGFVLAHHAGLGRLDQGLLSNVQTILRSHDKRVEFEQLGYPFEPAEIARFASANWQGLILTGGVQDHHVQALRMTRIPFVVAGTYHLDEPCDQARYDAETSVGGVFRRMFSSGLQRIGVIVGRRDYYGNQLAAEALAMESRVAGVPFDARQVIFDETDGEAPELVEQLLQAMGKPDGLWASGHVLQPVLRGLERLELRPRRDVVLAGIRNAEDRREAPFSYELRFQQHRWASTITEALLDRLKRGPDSQPHTYSIPIMLIESAVSPKRRRPVLAAAGT